MKNTKSFEKQRLYTILQVIYSQVCMNSIIHSLYVHIKLYIYIICISTLSLSSPICQILGCTLTHSIIPYNKEFTFIPSNPLQSFCFLLCMFPFFSCIFTSLFG